MAIQKLKLCEHLSLKLYEAKCTRSNEYRDLKLCILLYISNLQDMHG